MGPSGSGKTTLLDILSLREGKGGSRRKGGRKGGREGGKGARVGGEVALVMPGEEEAVELGKEGGGERGREVRRAFGFLDQEHRLTPTLTVGESVLMAAVLRGGGRERGMEERQRRVGQVLRSLHMDHLVHARIGG